MFKKTILFPTILALAACTGGPQDTDPDLDDVIPEAPDAMEGTSTMTTDRGDALEGSGLRFDGTYEVVLGERIVYLVRFFPEGQAVLVAGPVDTRDQLVSKLEADAVTEPEIGFYNVPVSLRNDSILFVTQAMKGAIDYACKLQGSDTLRVLKHSHVNGKRALLDYLFTPDA